MARRSDLWPHNRRDPGNVGANMQADRVQEGFLRYQSRKLVFISIAAAAALLGIIGGFINHALRVRPTPHLVFAPPNPSLSADAPIGTFVALVIVTMSDGSVFNGTLGFGPPYGDAQGCFAIRDRSIVLACQLPPPSVKHITVTAIP